MAWEPCQPEDFQGTSASTGLLFCQRCLPALPENVKTEPENATEFSAYNFRPIENVELWSGGLERLPSLFALSGVYNILEQNTRIGHLPCDIFIQPRNALGYIHPTIIFK